jgi:hypothetical protein
VHKEDHPMTNRLTLVAALCVVLLPLHARGQDQTQEREQAGQRVRETLRTQGQLPEEAMEHLGEGIDRHAGEHGYGEAVTNVVRESLQVGCTGTCLAEAVRSVNGAMDRGATASEAGRQAASAARDRARAGRADAAERGTAERDRARERSHDRARDRAGAMGGGAAGGMGGGMRGGRP